MIVAIADPFVAKFVPSYPQRPPTAKKFKHFPDAAGACDMDLPLVTMPMVSEEQKG